MTPRVRTAVLVSGGGTNLQALLDAARAPDYPAEIALVLSNVADVRALDRAREAGVEAVTLSQKGFAQREDYDRALVAHLRERRVELVCLAGFMRLLTAAFLTPFAGRVLNVHPSLLPAFPGMHAQRQALEHGVKVAGCTVHFVDSGLDSGAIVAQAPVPVLEGDDEAALRERILREEHRLYPLALRWLAEGRLEVRGRQVHVLANG